MTWSFSLEVLTPTSHNSDSSGCESERALTFANEQMSWIKPRQHTIPSPACVYTRWLSGWLPGSGDCSVVSPLHWMASATLDGWLSTRYLALDTQEMTDVTFLPAIRVCYHIGRTQMSTVNHKFCYHCHCRCSRSSRRLGGEPLARGIPWPRSYFHYCLSSFKLNYDLVVTTLLLEILLVLHVSVFAPVLTHLMICFVIVVQKPQLIKGWKRNKNGQKSTHRSFSVEKVKGTSIDIHFHQCYTC